MEIDRSLAASRSGLEAQMLRMRVIAENLANQDSTGRPGGTEPYRRRMVTFSATLDRATGALGVAPGRVVGDRSPFGQVYQPGHPAADTRGYVRQPNVVGLVEQADMKAAQRSYEANLAAVEAARSMAGKTLDLMR